MGNGETCSEMSQITVDSSEMVQRASDLKYAEIEVREMEWTNEKHCLYLKSMEMSFVNELYCSMGLSRGRALENNLFGQHKSFRDGSWKNVGVNECGSKLETRFETRALMTNPWIKHFRGNYKHQAVKAEKEVEIEKKMNLVSDNKSRQSTTTLLRLDSVGSITEMSDQNFNDSDEPMESCSVRRAKRKNMEANNNADSDQVVPKDLTPTSDCKRMALKINAK